MHVSTMPSENMRWDTLDALKNSTKGKLKYSSDWLEKEEVRPAVNRQLHLF